MKTKLLVSILAVVVLSFNSCKKDDDSKLQPKGSYGNANITSSTTVTLNNWSSDYDDGTNFVYSSTITMGAITQSVKDNGIVMVYIQNGAEWIAMPWSDASLTSSDGYNLNIGTGYVRLEYTGYDNSGSPGASSQNGLVARVVVIGGAGRMANPNLDYKNYNAVKAAFNLKD